MVTNLSGPQIKAELAIALFPTLNDFILNWNKRASEVYALSMERSILGEAVPEDQCLRRKMLRGICRKEMRVFHMRKGPYFNGGLWDVPGGHMTNWTLCNNLFGSWADVKKNPTVNFRWKEILLVSRVHGRRWWTGRKTKPEECL